MWPSVFWSTFCLYKIAANPPRLPPRQFTLSNIVAFRFESGKHSFPCSSFFLRRTRETSSRWRNDIEIYRMGSVWIFRTKVFQRSLNSSRNPIPLSRLHLITKGDHGTVSRSLPSVTFRATEFSFQSRHSFLRDRRRAQLHFVITARTIIRRRSEISETETW